MEWYMEIPLDLPQPLVNKITQLAQEEHISVSEMATILLMEGVSHEIGLLPPSTSPSPESKIDD